MYSFRFCKGFEGNAELHRNYKQSSHLLTDWPDTSTSVLTRGKAYPCPGGALRDASDCCSLYLITNYHSAYVVGGGVRCSLLTPFQLLAGDLAILRTPVLRLVSYD